MAIKTWDEVRTAYHVARAGTVSGAAEALGVHHATVIRHVDALEAQLGVRLFQRHPRGYTTTEAGAELLRVAQATDDQFTQLANRIKGHGEAVTGELIVTSLAQLSGFLTPALVRFQAMHPGLIVRLLTDERLYRLEYGEAHVAVRAGQPPQEPDNVAQEFSADPFALYASRAYVDRHGIPDDDAALATHVFVSHDDEAPRPPFYRWLAKTVPADRVVFRAIDGLVIRDAILAGAGIGFLSVAQADALPDLVQIAPPRADWRARIWLVTHIDLHRTTKVQALLSFLKREARGASCGSGVAAEYRSRWEPEREAGVEAKSGRDLS